MKIKATSLSFYSSLANARGSSSAYNSPSLIPLIGSNSHCSVTSTQPLTAKLFMLLANSHLSKTVGYLHLNFLVIKPRKTQHPRCFEIVKSKTLTLLLSRTETETDNLCTSHSQVLTWYIALWYIGILPKVNFTTKQTARVISPLSITV